MSAASKDQQSESSSHLQSTKVAVLKPASKAEGIADKALEPWLTYCATK